MSQRQIKKIGVFDSGVGGITVLNELRNRFSGVDFVYLGDTAHVPYGPKSSAQIRALSVECVKILKARGVSALVVACNTASSHALPAMQAEMGSIPVFGVVEPGVEAALAGAATLQVDAPILVLATRATVRSQAYARALAAQTSTTVFQQACPLLVPMIEEGWIDHPLLHATLAEYLRPYVGKVPGVALLGCTHYPWIHVAIEKALPGWKVVDSSWAIANALELRLDAKVVGAQGSEGGSVEWIFTDPDAVPEFAKKWITPF